MDNIEVTVKNIRSDVKENKTEDYLSEKFKEFKKKYPKHLICVFLQVLRINI